MREFSDDNNEVPSQPDTAGDPKFGRLLVVLVLVVLAIIGLTFASEAYFS